MSDSLNEEDEVEDENRSPVSMQINYSNNVTRAGVQRGNFGPTRKLSPTMPKPNNGMPAGHERGLRAQLDIGTEETVIRGVDHRLTQSPSIMDVAATGNQVTPASSFVSLVKDNN